MLYRLVIQFVETGDLRMPRKAKIVLKLTLNWIPNDNEILLEDFQTMNFKNKTTSLFKGNGFTSCD